MFYRVDEEKQIIYINIIYLLIFNPAKRVRNKNTDNETNHSPYPEYHSGGLRATCCGRCVCLSLSADRMQ